MTAINIDSEKNAKSAVAFQERHRCISCGSSQLSTVWQGQFSDEPTRSFMERCHYDADVVQLLGSATFNLVKCDDCGMTFHRQIMSPEWLKSLYSEWINDAQMAHLEAEYNVGSKSQMLFELGRKATIHMLRLQQLLRQDTSEPRRILDYGCGDGHFLGVAKLFGFEIYGVDFSTVRQEQAAKIGINIFNDLKSLKQQQIPKMHAVSLFQVLEHLEDPLALLHELAEIMAEDSILIVEVPDCRGISQPDNFLDFHFVHPLEHINAFTPSSLKTMCERAGFVSIKRLPAHVTTRFVDVCRTEVSRFIQPARTFQYFKLPKK